MFFISASCPVDNFFLSTNKRTKVGNQGKVVVWLYGPYAHQAENAQYILYCPISPSLCDMPFE